ncbi:MAG: Poly-beta-1,6-N-acetyl-D-glucosamine N-deacetylase [Gammaproteobacteria bacterium]|nr:Poly-beta-1,6-N-acetyl-D-glucosamine N-deacetylase [Gammaproteobacteria bacterium]
MRVLLAFLAVWMSVAPAQAAPPNQTFDVFCYHDVRDDVEDDIDIDPIATSTQRLTQHFAWLREHGYRPVSVDDILAARAGTRGLPPKAVLLTFDDGYVSFFTRVYPLLKAFGYPAVLALVGSWLDVPAGGVVEYGTEKAARSRFLSLAQIREMSASGLVEFASHSYALHRGVQGNPQGNEEPAAATRIYSPGTRAYEDAAAYRARLRADLERNSAFIGEATGKRPRVMVWPYGAYSRVGVQVAADLGMSLSLTLRDGVATLSALDSVPRHLMEANAPLPALVWMLQRRPGTTPIRVAHVDLDYLYDEDAAQMDRNLDVLLERIKSLQINTVYLQAFADPDADGTASAMYFPNRHLPVRADLFNRVAWQLKTRAGVRVYAWMPVLAYDPGGRPAPASLRVQSEPGDESAANAYRRLSPFNVRARAIVREIYEDLAAHAHFDGVLYHDDALLSDHEDVSPDALRVYRDAWRLPGPTAAIRADPGMARRWARLKTRYLIDFTRELTNTVRTMRPDIKTARNLYASVVMDPDSEAWFAQDADEFAATYDYVALMAMPYMEEAPDAEEWLRILAARIAPSTRAKTVFELQSRDWRTGTPVPGAALAGQMSVLADAGVRHYGYYPDDFIGGHPDLALVFPAMSLSDYPHRPPGTRDLSRLYSGVLTP